MESEKGYRKTDTLDALTTSQRLNQAILRSLDWLCQLHAITRLGRGISPRSICSSSLVSHCATCGAYLSFTYPQQFWLLHTYFAHRCVSLCLPLHTQWAWPLRPILNDSPTRFPLGLSTSCVKRFDLGSDVKGLLVFDEQFYLLCYFSTLV